ncbi:uncharacterized protein LOC142492354 [Ascaphus truei]|uniref:uncharacterized protein LOC142492354 n=1 Tax=Ascaphus truei TaxID=8439 RepID=UPI003F59E3D7
MAARPQTRYSLRQSAGVQLSSVDFEVQRGAVKKDNHPIHATRMKKQKITRLKEKTRSKFSDSQTCEGVAKCDSPEKSRTAVVNKEPGSMSKQRWSRQIASDDDDDDDEDCCTEAHSSVAKDVQGLSIEKQAMKQKVPEDMATQDSDRHQIPQKLKKSIRKKVKKDNHPIHATRMKKQKIKRLKEKTRSKFSDSQTCEGVAKCDSPEKSSTAVIVNKEPGSMSKQRWSRQIAYDDDDEDCCTEAHSSVVKDVQGLSIEKQAMKRKVPEDMATQDSDRHQIPQKLKKSIRKKGKKDNKPIRATRMKKQKLKHLRKKTRSKFSDSQTCEGVAKCDSPKKSTTTVIIHEEPSPSKQTRLWQIAYDDDDDDEDCCTEPQSSVVKDVQGLSLEKQARERKVPEDMTIQDFEMHQIEQKLKKSICIKDSLRTRRPIPSGEPEKER